MGATYQHRIFPLMPKEDLQREFKILQDEMTRQFGDDTYAGHLGIKDGLQISVRKFESAQLAYDWISSNNDKWGPATAVQCLHIGVPEFPYTASDKVLKQRLDKLKKEKDSFDDEIVKRVRKQRSKLKTCESCKSKVAVKYIKDKYCPVCSAGGFLYTATDIKKHHRLTERICELLDKINARTQDIKIKDKGKQHKKYVWYVGGWCAC